MISQPTAASINHNKISPQVLFILSSETSKNKRPLQTCHRGFCFILCAINQMSQIFTFLSPLGTQTWTWRGMVESTCSIPIEATRTKGCRIWYLANHVLLLPLPSGVLCCSYTSSVSPHNQYFSSMRSFPQRVFQLSTSFDFLQCQFMSQSETC